MQTTQILTGRRDVLSGRFSGPRAKVATPTLTSGLTTGHTGAVVAGVAVETVVLVHGTRDIAVGTHGAVQSGRGACSTRRVVVRVVVRIVGVVVGQ